MDKFLNLTLSGLVTGAIYSLLASGVVLTYETSGMFNFAHPAVAFATAYFYWELNSGLKIPIIPSAILSVLVFAPILGILLDRIVLRRLGAAPVYARIVGTLGLLIALPNFAQWFVETVLIDTFHTPGLLNLTTVTATRGTVVVPGLGPTPPQVWHLSWLGLDKVVINSDQLAVFLVAAISAVLLYVVLRRTRVGLEMRALVDRDSLAALRGVNPARTSAFAWTLSMVLAGIGGVLIGPLLQLDLTAYEFIVLGSLFAVVFGGIRSIPLAWAAGLGLGVVQNTVAGYSGSILPRFLNQLSGFKTSVPFVLTLVVLLIANRRHSRRAAGTFAEEKPAPDHRDGLPRWRRVLPWVIVDACLIIFALGWLHPGWARADSFELNGMLVPGMAFALIFLSFVVVTGIGGMVSLGQAAFITAGGFMAGWSVTKWHLHVPVLSSHGHLNFMLGCLLGALVAAALGALIAILVRRLGTLELALATLALALALNFIVFQNNSVSNGSAGYAFNGATWNVFGLHTFHFDVLNAKDSKQLFVLLFVLFGIITLCIRNLQRRASGRAMFAVRSSEVAARTSGISPAKSQVALFALSAGIAGFGAAWLGVANSNFDSSTADPIVGLFWLAVVVTLGIRRPGGALFAGLGVGAGAYIWNWIGSWWFFPHSVGGLLSSPYFATMLFGIGAVQLAQNPDGVLAKMGQDKLAKRRTKATAARIAAATAQGHDGRGGEPIISAHQKRVPDRVGTDGAGPVSADSKPPVLLLEGLVAAYGDVEVLHDVSVAVRGSEIVVLLGANGAGKSTMCAVAAGTLSPAIGRVHINGVDVTAASAYARTRAGLLVVPEGRGIFPGLSVEENLKVLLRKPEDRERAYERFPVLGQRRRQQAGHLSGGEQQMLSLAPVLCDPPAVLIADEPTLGLAPLVAQLVMEAMRELRNLGTGILLVEEKAREAMQVADTVAFMELGRLVWTGPRQDADEATLTAAYLGT